MSEKTPTPAQHNILVWLNKQADRMLCGPMETIVSHEARFSFSGGKGDNPTFKGVRLATGDAMLKAGWIEHVKDRYPLGYYRISDAGRAALARAEAK